MSALPFKLARACCKMHFLYNRPLSELHDKEVIKITVYIHNLLAVLYPPSEQSCLLSFWVRRRKEGSAWTASSLIEVTAAWTFRTVSLVFSSQTSFSRVRAYVWHPPSLAEVNTLSSAEAPGYPYNKSNNRKNRTCAGDSFPARFLFLSPQPPRNTKRPLRGKEEVTVFTWMSAVARVDFCVPQMWYSFDSGVYLLGRDKEFFLLVSVLRLVNTSIKKMCGFIQILGK